MNSLTTAPSGEVYTNGHAPAVLDFMRRRSLSTHGRFIESFLRQGLRILDLGCGPGNMTLEIASRVGTGGHVLGVDYVAEQWDEARAAARELSVSFQAMDVYRLELEDQSFDGIFSHALFEHLVHPVEALVEACRVLKPGGFIGLRSPDWGGVVLHPQDEKINAALIARQELQTRNGGDVYAGRQLAAWLRQAGFIEVTASASYEIYPDTAIIVDHLASQLEEDGQPVHGGAWREWGRNPEAMFAQAWFEAIGHKEEQQ